MHSRVTLVIMNVLECVVRETGPQPDACVIWLHGLGADGNDFEPIVPQLKRIGAVRFVFPHAPVRPVTINSGMRMRAWYDILELSIDRNADREGIDQSVEQVDALIDAEIERGFPPGRIVLAGFSQGGAIALRCGLTRSEPLAGIIALSCYLLDGDEFDQWLTPVNRTQSVLMAHGEQDPVVPVALGRNTADRLQRAGLNVDWHSWPMPHAVCPEEVAVIDRWLSEKLGKKASAAGTGAR